MVGSVYANRPTENRVIYQDHGIMLQNGTAVASISFVALFNLLKYSTDDSQKPQKKQKNNE